MKKTMLLSTIGVLACVSATSAMDSVVCEKLKAFCLQRGDKQDAALCMNNNTCPRQIMSSRHDDFFAQDCVLAHNAKRASMNAANMLEMSWDPELELAAQKNLMWNCEHGTLSHEQCRVSPTYGIFSQNLYNDDTTFNLGGSLCVRAVDLWFSQAGQARWGDIRSFPRDGVTRTGPIDQFANVMWAKSYKIGCAYVELSTDILHREILLACNYAQVGNVVGQPIFIRGTPASKCPKGSVPNVNTGLCTVSSLKLLRQTLDTV